MATTNLMILSRMFDATPRRLRMAWPFKQIYRGLFKHVVEPVNNHPNDFKILHIGNTPLSILESVVKRVGEIDSVAVVVEWKDKTNAIAFSDINAHELIGRLISGITYVGKKQFEITEDE